jgi:hypothetical protein
MYSDLKLILLKHYPKLHDHISVASRHPSDCPIVVEISLKEGPLDCNRSVNMTDVSSLEIYIRKCNVAYAAGTPLVSDETYDQMIARWQPYRQHISGLE